MADQHLKIAEMAKGVFTDHRLGRDRGYTWTFRKPGSWAYGVRVTWAPGAVMVSGDLGEIVYRGPNALWEGPWEAARFIAQCDFDYLTGKSSAERCYDRAATVAHLIRLADDEVRWGSNGVWEKICDRYSFGSLVKFAELNPAKATDQMRAAAAMRRDDELDARAAYDLVDGTDATVSSWPGRTRWQYEAVLRWAQAMAPTEPLTSKIARQRRRFTRWRAGLKSRPPIFRPKLFVGPPASHYGGLKYWRETTAGGWRLLAPFRFLGLDLSRAGFWRDQGSQMPARYGNEFTQADGGLHA